MNLRSRIWWMAALIFTLCNLAAALVAAAQEEQIHVDIHVALLLLGGYFVWRLAPRRVAHD
jgi:hypothetical protein